MNWLDIVIIVCIIIGIIHGLYTGIVKQVILLISLIVAILLSGTIATVIRHWMQAYVQNAPQWFSPNVQNAVYYILAFIFIVFLFSIAANLIDKIINYTPAGLINRLFGAVFGSFMWALCLSMGLNILAVFDNQSQVIPKSVKENSIFYDRTRMLFPTAFPYIKDFFKHETNG